MFAAGIVDFRVQWTNPQMGREKNSPEKKSTQNPGQNWKIVWPRELLLLGVNPVENDVKERERERVEM